MNVTPFTFPQTAVLRCYLCAQKCAAVEVLDAAKPQTFLRCSRGQTKYKGLLFWRSHILLINMCSRLHLCCSSSTQVKFKEKSIYSFFSQSFSLTFPDGNHDFRCLYIHVLTAACSPRWQYDECVVETVLFIQTFGPHY